MVKAGPSSPKKKAALVEDEALSVYSSDAESVDSHAIDDSPITPRPATATPAKARKSAPLPRYQAPVGMEPVSVSAGFKASPFEFEALSKRGVELWAVRVPADFKPSRLSSLALDRPTKSGVKGRLDRGGSYTLVNASEEGEGIGAEMAGMSLLVPNMKAGGKLQRAPIKIARRLILSPAEDKAATTPFTAPPKVKRTQPKPLKFRNRAFGFDTPGPSGTAGDYDDDAASVAAVAEPLPEDSPAKSPKNKKEDKEKRKKRKTEDGESPKKKKKRVKE